MTNRWVRERRGPKNPLNPAIPYAYLWEEEPDSDGNSVSIHTLFLTNRECPFTCLYCDLWKNTLDESVAPGAIPAQIQHAVSQMPRARSIKLYNAGSFFDDKAIPPEDDSEIAGLVSGYERVIVECHPSIIGERCLRFAEMIPGRLEVAIGLETAHPEVLARMNKQMTLESFRRAAELLAANGIDLRVFILVRPPYLTEAEGIEWGNRSLDFAFDCGAAVACVIPTRAGNGALEELERLGEFHSPSIVSLESVQEYGLSLKRGRVFADLWDIERFYGCGCSPARAERMGIMNRDQRIPTPVNCDKCGGVDGAV